MPKKPLAHNDFVKSLMAAPQDVSLPILRKLLAQGYKTVTWRTSESAMDAECISKDGDRFDLRTFISGLRHNAPIYEKTHVGCSCSVVLESPGKKPVIVNAFGIMK